MEEQELNGDVVEVHMIGLCDKMRVVTKQYRRLNNGVQEA